MNKTQFVKSTAADPIPLLQSYLPGLIGGGIDRIFYAQIQSLALSFTLNGGELASNRLNNSETISKTFKVKR